MALDEYWINLSIFYNKNDWHQLLNNCIYPFVRSMREKKYLSTYSFFISWNRGDNIRLSLLATNEYRWVLLDETDTFFKQYLKTFPSQRTNGPLFSNSIFMNFNENHIFYNLYKRQAIPFDEPIKRIIYEQQEYFSTMLIKELKDISDGESRLTMLTYCMWAAISVYTTNIEETLIYTKDLLQHLLWRNEMKNDKSLNSVDFDSKFKHYQSFLVEIKKDIWSNGVKSDTLRWLRNWKTFCKINIEKVENLISSDMAKAESRSTLKHQFQCFIFEAMQKQLGVTSAASACVVYFLNQISVLESQDCNNIGSLVRSDE